MGDRPRGGVGQSDLSEADHGHITVRFGSDGHCHHQP